MMAEFRIETLEEPGGSRSPQGGPRLPVHQHVLHEYISIDGKAAWRGKVFVERKWSPKKKRDT
jgi:hypothetical protein